MAVLGGPLLQLFVRILGTMVATWVVSARVTEHPTGQPPPHFALPTSPGLALLFPPSSTNPFELCRITPCFPTYLFIQSHAMLRGRWIWQTSKLAAAV